MIPQPAVVAWFASPRLALGLLSLSLQERTAARVSSTVARRVRLLHK